MALVLCEVADRVATVTLNDPGKRNAVSLQMNEELHDTFNSLESDEAVGAVVLTGAPPAFSAGANLQNLLDASNADELSAIYSGFLRLADCPLPTVAAVNGPATGAGMNFALACDLIIAGRSARFESGFLPIAIHPGGGHTWRLRNISGLQAAMAMAVFGEPVDGEAAVALGLAWKLAEDEDLLAEAQRIAARPAGVPRELAIRMKRTVIDMAGVTQSDSAVAREVGEQAWSMTQPEFRQRTAAVMKRISKSKPPAGPGRAAPTPPG